MPNLTCTLYQKCVFQYNVQYRVQVKSGKKDIHTYLIFNFYKNYL